MEALALRNRLAYDFLVEYRMSKVVAEDGVAWATQILSEVTRTFDELYRKLDAHADVQLEAAGIEDLT